MEQSSAYQIVSPFNSLPYELVSEIFQMAVVDAYDKDLVFAILKSNIAVLLAISKVCKRWREISLNIGSLWAAAINVDFRHPAWAQKVTRCAQTAPLMIDSAEIYENDEDTIAHDTLFFERPNWQHALACIGSWGAFSLRTGIHADNMDPFVRALTRPAPNLESFQINNDYGLWYIASDEPDYRYDRFALPDNLFAGHAPCLKKFAIRNACLRPSFDFSVWTKLTELFVDQCLGGLDGNKISARKWIGILREITQLEVLVLSSSYHDDYDDLLHFSSSGVASDHGISEVADVNLTRLRKLGIVATFERNIIFDVFPKLIVPDACVTSITVSHDYRHELAFDWLKAGLDRRVQDWDAANHPLSISLLNGVSEFGFRIEHIHTRSSDPMDYNFQFCYIGYGLEIRLLHNDPYVLKMLDAMENARASSPVAITNLAIESLPVNFNINENIFKYVE